jgi:hypothetical protein
MHGTVIHTSSYTTQVRQRRSKQPCSAKQHSRPLFPYLWYKHTEIAFNEREVSIHLSTEIQSFQSKIVN